MLLRAMFIVPLLLMLTLSGSTGQGNTTNTNSSPTFRTNTSATTTTPENIISSPTFKTNTSATTTTPGTFTTAKTNPDRTSYESSEAPSDYPTYYHYPGMCRCPGVSINCMRQEMRNSTYEECPPCPTSCSIPAPECSSNSECASGRGCEIRDDSSYKCESESEVGERCRYLDSCLDKEDCQMLLSGRKIEQICSPGLFCREIQRYDCIVIGECVSIENASNIEARCLQEQGTSSSHCSLNGNYKCSSTEKNADGSVIQTCYNITSGETIKTIERRSETDVIQEYCRRRSLATCRTGNGIVVLSGDAVDDPNDRCSYCLCDNGVMDRSVCRTNPRCVQAPENCHFDGRIIPHGRVINSKYTCAQMRCENGDLIGSTLDEDCDGIEDVDACYGGHDTELVCAISSGMRTRIPKCKAMSIGANYSDGRCGEDEVCECLNGEICVHKTQPRDICIAADENGCKYKRCIPINSNITCTTESRNRPVCSSNGVSYNSECEAFINQDFDIQYLRACDDPFCLNTNGGKGFCGFDNVTYSNLCELEIATGNTIRDYDGGCEMKTDEVSNKCETILAGCEFTTKASDSRCPIPGAQGILHIDVDEVQNYAFRKGKTEVDINDLCLEAESDWEILTDFPLYNDQCEFTCRHKYDTVGAIVIQVKAVSGKDCVECGERLGVFIQRLREDKIGKRISEMRRRRQTDESQSSGCGLFISPSELENDPSFQSSGNTITKSVFLIIASFVLTFMVQILILLCLLWLMSIDIRVRGQMAFDGLRDVATADTSTTSVTSTAGSSTTNSITSTAGISTANNVMLVDRDSTTSSTTSSSATRSTGSSTTNSITSTAGISTANNVMLVDRDSTTSSTTSSSATRSTGSSTTNSITSTAGSSTTNSITSRAGSSTTNSITSRAGSSTTSSSATRSTGSSTTNSVTRSAINSNPTTTYNDPTFGSGTTLASTTLYAALGSILTVILLLGGIMMFMSSALMYYCCVKCIKRYKKSNKIDIVTYLN
ncbi:hypothetical protein LOD99_12737 [Oopsacas minuta]|uniref:Kazal-like domain-containing protein n=1 Tax=Oopsacas minuta TaxID=111878 RepID=A0AAV7JDG4_9METZ|nr:hypothetical protein LOD99_12737 [Oopsacas minuta]